MIRTYLDWLLAVPWGKRSDERLDPVHAREILDDDHAGLEDVKERIVEYLAVRKLRQERGIAEDKRSGRDPDADRAARNGQDLGRRVDRPGAQSRVRAHVARRRARRGGDPRPPAHLHRRAAGPAGAGAARRRDDEPGDPARTRSTRSAPTGAAIHRPRCSRCSTPRRTTRSATTTSTSSSTSPRSSSSPRRTSRRRSPGPLLDRMEVIRFDGYTVDEKVAIARGYLWPRQRERAGLREDEVVDRRPDPRADRQPVHARGRRPPARARARQAAAEDGDDAWRPARAQPPISIDEAAVRDALGRPRSSTRVGRPNGRARRGHRPCGDRDGRRRAVRRGDQDAGRRTGSS